MELDTSEMRVHVCVYVGMYTCVNIYIYTQDVYIFSYFFPVTFHFDGGQI